MNVIIVRQDWLTVFFVLITNYMRIASEGGQMRGVETDWLSEGKT